MLQGAAFARDWRWIAGAALVYVVVVVTSVLTLAPYFAQTWDVVTFVGAGRTVLSPDWNALYEVSRADRVWPYAYPPLHAFLVAPFVAAAGGVPDWLLVRIPPLLFDVGLGILLYEIVALKTREVAYARAALAVWLLNPVTWYDTAVQGHFEAEWLFFVVLAYWLAEKPTVGRTTQKSGETFYQWSLALFREGWLLPTLALAAAFLIKQNAVLFALPFWAQLLLDSGSGSWRQRGLRIIASMVVFAAPVALVSLPFLAHSNDYWYMNVQYVANVPLQTQSWLVAVAGLDSPENILLRASSLLTLAAAAVLALWAARRGLGLWLAGMAIVLAFFLLSKKVVGYYYVMILPFALVALLPTKHVRALLLIVAACALTSLAPYFAAWTDPAHWWAYALLGIAASGLWLALLVWVWRAGIRARPIRDQTARADLAALTFFSVALFFVAAAAALLQPWVSSATSPIRAPLVLPGQEIQTAIVGGVFGVLVLAALFAASRLARAAARSDAISPVLYALAALFAPLYFLTFTLTKESTAALELALQSLGL